MTDRYEPEYPSEVLTEYVYRELQRVSQTMEQIQVGHMDRLYTSVDKPRDGDMRYFSDDVLSQGMYLYQTDRWTRVNTHTVSVTDFGADPTGATDSTSAIQQAIDNLLSSGRRGVVYLPPGDYLTSATITLQGLSVRMQGETSEFSTVIKASHTDGPVIRVLNRNSGIKDIEIDSTGARTSATAGTNYGILIEGEDEAGKAADRGTYEKLYVQNQPAHGIVVIGESYHCRFTQCVIRDNGSHGMVYDDGTATSRTNKALSGISTISECEIFDNGGHGVIVGNDNNGISNRGLRVIIENCDIFRNAEATGTRKSADQLWIFGDLCTVRDTALGGHDQAETAATTRGALVHGRSNRFMNNRYLNVTPQALRFSVISGWPTEGYVVDEMFVVGSNQGNLSPAVLVDSDVGDGRVQSRNTFRVERLATEGVARDHNVRMVKKISSEDVTNDTTLQDDDVLLAPLLANERVGFECELFVLGPAAADIKVAFTVPASATLRWGPKGNIKVDAADAVVSQDSVASGSITFGTHPTNVRTISLVGEVVCGGTAGNLQLQFAQDTADATATSIRAQSRLVTYH